MPLIYRIWTAARHSEVEQWMGQRRTDKERARGSALDAAWELALEGELAAGSNEHMAAALLDRTKAYELVPLRMLEAAAVRAQFPERSSCPPCTLTLAGAGFG